ncbi:Flp family type IVb pilin [Oharaeibacter diazotrophicus]|uniref:Flp pilus assembly pilin Flp n=1 Tax=Oharaeibacter diazotrophicus TaxID=1920512 RepID=A0A4R6R561_9HYPH|nr:Flp family type IVb pilin [Oharaeibacter diazotrophicus]TDP80939.1 Flp pilus assembly pilin Flp [Oharaeibacter diazotrophicus]
MTTTGPGTGAFRRTIRRFAGDRRGAVAVEYGALLLMIVVALLGLSTLSSVSDKENDTFNTISDALR